MAQIVIFNNADFSGNALLVTDGLATLGKFDLNDRVSSFIVLSGLWEFYERPNFQIPYQRRLGPGQYNWVEAVDIANDSISSLRAVG